MNERGPVTPMPARQLFAGFRRGSLNRRNVMKTHVACTWALILMSGLGAREGWAGVADDRAVCEARDSATTAFDREIACTAILAEPGLSPSSAAMTLVHRAWSRTQMSRQTDAMADYDRAISLSPGSYIALNERALLLLREGRLDAALADYNAALKIAPGEAYPHFGRGLTYLRKGNKRNGEADLKMARITDPGVDDVFRKIGLSR